jgi:AAT family amino acid transporter
MLIIMFTYAGFEIIGLASSETAQPEKTVPKAIRYTVIGLVGLYLTSNVVLLSLIPTAELSEDVSPIVAALNRQGIPWAGTAINVVLITAILSTMLACMFAIGRMMRSLAEGGLTPRWLKDKTDVPYRGILFSGLSMLLALWFGMFFPRVYLFLISSAGFSILFCYVMIMATHIRFRRTPQYTSAENRPLHRFPYSSLFTLLALIAAIFSMPFVEGQTSGLIAGIVIVIFYILSYLLVRAYQYKGKRVRQVFPSKRRLQFELSEELSNLNLEEKDNE